jgi:hypothetical protein
MACFNPQWLESDSWKALGGRHDVQKDGQLLTRDVAGPDTGGESVENLMGGRAGEIWTRMTFGSDAKAILGECEALVTSDRAVYLEERGGSRTGVSWMLVFLRNNRASMFIYVCHLSDVGIVSIQIELTSWDLFTSRPFCKGTILLDEEWW